MTVKLIGSITSADVYMVGSDQIELGSQLEQNTAGRVLDVDRQTLFRPTPIHSIIAHMPRFREYEGDDGELQELLSGVNVRGPPIADTPFKINTHGHRHDSKSK
jgi:hypothetical protein